MSGRPAHRHLGALLAERQFRLGSAILLLVLAVALLGPLLAPHRPDALIGIPFAPGDGAAPLGYDSLGRDIWSRLLHGGGSLVWMTLASTGLALLAGTPPGLLGAFRGGRTDAVVVWLTDLLLTFPEVILILLVVSMLGREPWLIVATVAIAFVPGVTRLTRALALQEVRREYVEAARLLGFSAPTILFREVLPNLVGPLLVHGGIMLTWAVAVLSGLSFLGYGVAPPAADWGLMVAENRSGLFAQPMAVLAPIVLVALFAIGANLIAESLSRVIGQTEEAP